MERDIIISNFEEYLKDCKIPMITIYDTPLDYKGLFVARLFDIKENQVLRSNIVCINESLEKLRESIPSWMLFLNRNINDDTCIMGTYV